MSDEPKQVDPKWAAKVTPELVESVKTKARDGKVTCPVLRKFAEDNNIPYKVAGYAADAAGIKVHNCDLGCF